jgi:hypothetical protein
MYLHLWATVTPHLYTCLSQNWVCYFGDTEA